MGRRAEHRSADHGLACSPARSATTSSTRAAPNCCASSTAAASRSVRTAPASCRRNLLLAASFTYLAANVLDSQTGQPVLLKPTGSPTSRASRSA
ncbi:hypothetical protein LP419_10960 [Massilia sp. H-1]|nr:hypothetical protein LP419_10960 [Massilia sp. H-1]